MKTQIANFLSKMIAAEVGFAEAHALYCESFKDSTTFKVADEVYSRKDLLVALMEDICEPVAFLAPDWWEPAVIKEGLSFEEADKIVDHVEFVELCNYKGEGEGFTLACRAAHLRTFVSKHNYL